jgi:hypothetical protein
LDVVGESIPLRHMVFEYRKADPCLCFVLLHYKWTEYSTSLEANKNQKKKREREKTLAAKKQLMDIFDCDEIEIAKLREVKVWMPTLPQPVFVAKFRGQNSSLCQIRRL